MARFRDGGTDDGREATGGIGPPGSVSRRRLLQGAAAAGLTLAAQLDAAGRTPGSGQPSIRHHRLLGRGERGNLPAVSFLKAGGYQQGGGDDSDPLDEQEFIVGLVNRLERLPSWHSTAVVIMYDDSDGAYDHVMPPILNDSETIDDALTGPGLCGTATPVLGGYQGRCGYGPRLPFMIISPWARVNHVDHTLTDETSVIHFVEDNWLDGERIGDGSYDALSGPLTGMFNFESRAPTARDLFLNPDTDEPLGAPVR